MARAYRRLPTNSLYGGEVIDFIVLSNHYRICDHFIDHDLRPTLATFLRKADIAVHELVVAMIHFRDFASRTRTEVGRSPFAAKQRNRDRLQEFNNRHTLGYGSARTDAFGGSLQRTEFEGDDLAAVSLFTEAVPVVRFRNCGIRRKTMGDAGFPGSYELVRLGKTGFLSFATPETARGQRERFKEVEGLLRSLNRFGFIK